MTLRPYLLRAAVAPVAFVVGVLIASVIIAVRGPVAAPQSQSSATPPRVESPVEALIARHDCWSGDAPADMVGKVPGAVVVTRTGQPFLGGPRVVEQALEQIFDGVDHGLTVHAFCRSAS